MKYFVAGFTALAASLVLTASAGAVDVCNYTVRMAMGVRCPLFGGDTACLSVNAAIGPCQDTLRCFGGPGFFCSATLIPQSGPQQKCAFGSKRASGFKCFAPARLFNTRTPTPSGEETPTFTFTPTETPTGEAEATATDTPIVEVPTATATGVPTGTATATATDIAQATPTDTVGVATATATDTPQPPATSTATEAPTGTPTGTAAAALMLRF